MKIYTDDTGTRADTPYVILEDSAGNRFRLSETAEGIEVNLMTNYLEGLALLPKAGNVAVIGVHSRQPR